MKMTDIFDQNGNFKERAYDPWRVDSRFEEIHNYLFDDNGFLNQHGSYEDWVTYKLESFIVGNELHWDCDAVKLLYASRFADNTKGNYGANTAWR